MYCLVAALSLPWILPLALRDQNAASGHRDILKAHFGTPRPAATPESHDTSKPTMATFLAGEHTKSAKKELPRRYAEGSSVRRLKRLGLRQGLFVATGRKTNPNQTEDDQQGR